MPVTLTEAPLRCQCGAICIEISRVGYNIPRAAWTLLFGEQRPPRKTLRACDYCVNGYGIDLCGCGSKSKFGRCRNHYPECAEPSQRLNLDRYTATTPPQDLAPWLYIRLEHGRNHMDDDMSEGYGFEGPAFAVKFIDIEYAPHNGIRLRQLWADSADDREEGWLRWVEDCIYYGGKFYGNVGFYADDSIIKSCLEKFESAKAKIPDGLNEEKEETPKPQVRRKQVLVRV